MSDSLWELFEQESESYLAEIEATLSGSAQDLADPEAMGALFRAFHSLKGVSASLGLTGLETVAHYGEDLLDVFRNGEAEPDEAARELLLYTADTLVALREACLKGRSDVPGDAALVADLKQAKQRLRGGGAAPAPTAAPTPTAAPIPAPARRLEVSPAVAPASPAQAAPKPAPAPQAASPKPKRSSKLQVSRAPAGPAEIEFQPDVVEAFDAVVSAELGHLAEALETPGQETLDSQEIAGSVLPIREAANDAGYFGITDVLDGIVDVLRESENLDKTALTRGLCIFVHRLRVLSELAGSGLSMENVDDSMSPHISREARDVIDRLSIAGGASKDWELVSVLGRALGVPKLSALARLTSELTAFGDWRRRPGALAVVDEIRHESQVIGIEGLNVASLDVRTEAYDRLRDQMALLLTNAEAAVAELRQQLGDDMFDSLSPDARTRTVDFLKNPGASLLEIQARLVDGSPGAAELMARIEQEQVISNRVLVEIDPDLYQFLVGMKGEPQRLVGALKSIDGTAGALQSWTVLVQGETPEGPVPPAAADTTADITADPADADSGYLVVAEDEWEILPQQKRAPEPRRSAPPQVAELAEWAPMDAADGLAVDSAAPASTPVSTAAPASAESAARELSPAGSVSKEPAERRDTQATKGGGGSSLRVSSELVDNYLDSVAELRLCLSRLEQGASEAGFASTTAELRSAATQTSARTAERLRTAARQIDNAGKVIASQIARAETTLRMLHSVTLDLRVVPISIVLGRMPRLVRDLARSLGKQVHLDIEDGDIQIDKSMVDALMEPMVHMIRNAMDHGIERAEDRARAGKPAQATLTLKATQSGNVARIMIADDGRGLNTAVIRAKAIERGLITEQDAMRMADREIQRLIFAPGFSTAAKITETSGRGVGMDVVLVTIRRLGGSIDIDSVEGEGTRFFLNFPVSAALQRIVVVSDGERDLGLPERAIVEVIEVERRAIQTVGELAGIQHRDGFLPVRPIETMLGWSTPEAAARQTVFPVVIIGTPERRVGVAVARVKRRQEVFMKELHPALNAVDVLAGATVMGEGQPLLVLDPETLIAIAGA